jgi:hypothetical protein
LPAARVQEDWRRWLAGQRPIHTRLACDGGFASASFDHARDAFVGAYGITI